MRRQNIPQIDEGTFSLSIGDLMAALLLIFILLLASTLLQLQGEFEAKSQVAERYYDVRHNLYEDLRETFEADLKRWNAEIDSNLVIRFKSPDVLFDRGEYMLDPKFKSILFSFFPRYLEVLEKAEFKDHIEEIRIEGHTDSDGDYFFNMKLSQDRTRAVLDYCTGKLEGEQKEWVRSKITANGLSFSKPILDSQTGKEDKAASRRVEFRIRTDAEAQIQEILKFSQGDE